MVCAVGLGAPQTAMFHLWTHAFFKALLFLGAGAVIYALHHEQNIWRMGGLWRRMPKTFGAFAIGTLALMGCWPFAGFFSKDAVLMAAFSGTTFAPHTSTNQWIFGLALVVALLTAFYMGRLVFVAFLGKARTPEAEHGHDGPVAMTWPLLILAALSVVAGWPFIAHGVFGGEFMEQLEGTAQNGVVPLLATSAFLIGAIFAFLLYGKAEKEPLTIALFRDKFYIDEFYAALIAGTHDLLALLSGFVDKWIIDGLFVRGLSGATWGVGFLLRFFQFGNLQGYAFLFGAGAVALLFFMLWVR
jgi:NADH-quinone oxidoreductase subunit L